MVLAIIAAAVYVTVQISVHPASQASTAKPKPRPAPIATAAPTAILSEKEEKERCKKVKRECIDYCSDTALPTPDDGNKFFNCKNQCLERHGCPWDS
jgi:hypothetical protein